MVNNYEPPLRRYYTHRINLILRNKSDPDTNLLVTECNEGDFKAIYDMLHLLEITPLADYLVIERIYVTQNNIF